MTIRQIRHPGPLATQRWCALPCRVTPLQLTLRPGMTFNKAVEEAFFDAGFRSGYAALCNAPMAHMNYVIPAGSPGKTHAAWYSQTHTAPAGAIIERAGLHFGERDGAPFLHCHGIWRDATGAPVMGHILPFDAKLAQAVTVAALGIKGAGLQAEDDAETNFRLFTPKPADDEPAEKAIRGLLATVRPNVDIGTAIETMCQDAHMNDARIYGIGSLVGADYADGTHVSSYATEVLIRDGRLTSTAAGPQSRLDIDLVDMDGALTGGVLVRGTNPVCVTFELLIVENEQRSG